MQAMQATAGSVLLHIFLWRVLCRGAEVEAVAVQTDDELAAAAAALVEAGTQGAAWHREKAGSTAVTLHCEFVKASSYSKWKQAKAIFLLHVSVAIMQLPIGFEDAIV